MESNSEQITLYALLVGESGTWTLQDTAEAVKHFSDIDLVYGMATTSRLGLAFQLAFGERDLRTLRVVGLAMPAIGTEIQRRGGDPLQINLDLAWQRWCEMVRNNAGEAEAIPTHRIAELRHVIIEALPLLGDGPDSGAAAQALSEAAAAISALLTSRGFSTDAYTGEAYEA